MVTFFVDSRNDTEVVYKYFPEGHTDKSYGLIKVDLVGEAVSVKAVAEEDFFM